jgi:hypothetical protein
MMGFELCDAIMSEHRHRVNQRASQWQRPDFPDVGHYNPWLVDALQNILEERWGVLYYSGWANSSDYTLINKINSLELVQGKPNLSRDKVFYAARTGLVVPALPFMTIEEKKLYPKLVLHCQFANMTLYSDMSEHEALCHAILPHVNGVNVFPKLPVYVRLYKRKRLKNCNARDSSKQMECEIEQLQHVNVATTESERGHPTVGPLSDVPVFVGLPTFGHLSIPVAPTVPATFMGMVGHNVGCIPGPIVVGNARIDTGTNFALVGSSKSMPKRGKDSKKRGGGVPAAVVVEAISSVIVLKQEDTVGERKLAKKTPKWMGLKFFAKNVGRLLLMPSKLALGLKCHGLASSSLALVRGGCSIGIS